MLKWWRRAVHLEIKRRKAVPEILAQPNTRKRRRVEQRFDVFDTGVLDSKLFVTNLASVTNTCRVSKLSNEAQVLNGGNGVQREILMLRVELEKVLGLREKRTKKSKYGTVRNVIYKLRNSIPLQTRKSSRLH